MEGHKMLQGDKMQDQVVVTQHGHKYEYEYILVSRIGSKVVYPKKVLVVDGLIQYLKPFYF